VAATRAFVYAGVVEALKLLKALSPGGATMTRRRASPGAVPIAGAKAPLPDFIERDGENAVWFRSR
jgi:hypothetical protein